MSKDFGYLRHWIMGWHGTDTSRHEPRPVILECIPSRSGMSMGVHDRGKRIFTINGCGFDRIGTALGDFLEKCFQPELRDLDHEIELGSLPGFHTYASHVSLRGETGFESMAAIAQAIGLKVHRSESKSGTLLIIEKGI